MFALAVVVVSTAKSVAAGGSGGVDEDVNFFLNGGDLGGKDK